MSGGSDIRHNFVLACCILTVIAATFGLLITNAFNAPGAGSLAPLNITGINITSEVATGATGQTFFDSLLGISTGSDAVDAVIVAVVGLFVGYIIIGWIRGW